MKKLFLSFCAIICLAISTEAATLQQMRFHCANDTLKINELLKQGIASGLTDANDIVMKYCELLMGTEYVAHTLEGEKEMLTINIDQLDCTTFVETLYALTRTTLSGRYSWRDYAQHLESIRYRNGIIKGYASRLHYISDWIIDNAYRGNLKEVTQNIPGAKYNVKNIDFMSKNRDKYPSLADDETFATIKSNEIGYRNHRFPFLKVEWNNINKIKSHLKEGDFVAIVTKIKGLDVQHMGVITKKDGIPYLLNASSAGKKVQVEEEDLAEYLRRSKNAIGIRIFRMVE